MADFRDSPLYDVALAEVVRCIPPELSESAPIRLEHVRELMCLAWMRGASWERERVRRETVNR